ncbi:MAG: S53 family peptidase [Solirubrobacteraceae bacterium]
MATVTDRLRRGASPSLRPAALTALGVLAALMAVAVLATLAPAQATAAARPGHRSRADGGAGLATPAPSAQARAGALAQLTGLRASQVRAAASCPPVGPGVARCAAQALVLRSTDRLVRPRIIRRATLRQVLPRIVGGFAPADATPTAAPQPGTPDYLQQAYDLSFLSQTAGVGDTIAVVDAYDDPNAESDLTNFRATYGLPACTSANGCFSKVNEYGAAAPLPPADSGWETEISLDLDAVSALCPNCHVLLVEANGPNLNDMARAQATAATLGARQISDSWSVASSSPIPGTYTFPNVSVVAATGDSGYDGPGWDAYPAAFPDVTAVGGTTLTPSSSSAPSARGFSESAWSLSGGSGGGSGCDQAEAKPAYQSDTGCTGRSYSDVSADGNPATGLTVYDSGNGGWLLVGGTSLSTPLIAAYEAVTGVSGATPQWAYADSALLNDPASGSNGACSIPYICNAGVGYDGPTGAGSISGAVATGAPGIGGPTVGPGSGNTYAEAVGAGNATLTAGIYPNGLATTYVWQYGPTTAYGQQTPAAPIAAGTAPVAISTVLSGLGAGATYHYRLVAANADGTTYGYDYTLTTGAAPPAAAAAPAISGTARQGQSLAAAVGAWSPAAGSYAYQWRRSAAGGWRAITGATGPTYTLTAADAGAQIEVLVTAANAYGSATAASAPVGPVAGASHTQPRPTRQPARAASAGTRRHGSARSVSAVLLAGRRTLRTGHGRRLAYVDVSVLARGAIRSVSAGAEQLARTVVVRRARHVTGGLRVWACSTARSARRGERTCTKAVTLRSVARFRLPAWMRGRVRVVVSLSGRRG